MKVIGYNYSPSMLRERVSGFSSLTPRARHALRDLLDAIWESADMTVSDDQAMVTSFGFTRYEWVSVRQELVVLPRKFISLEAGMWRSRWLERQAGHSVDIDVSNPDISRSYDFIAPLGEDEGEDDDAPLSLNSRDSDSEHEASRRLSRSGDAELASSTSRQKENSLGGRARKINRSFLERRRK